MGTIVPSSVCLNFSSRLPATFLCFSCALWVLIFQTFIVIIFPEKNNSLLFTFPILLKMSLFVLSVFSPSLISRLYSLKRFFSSHFWLIFLSFTAIYMISHYIAVPNSCGYRKYSCRVECPWLSWFLGINDHPTFGMRRGGKDDNVYRDRFNLVQILHLLGIGTSLSTARRYHL